MNATEIKQVNINDLVPYENNPRNNEQAVDKVANSIKEFPSSKYHLIPNIIREAHRYQAKIHGLGFTRFSLLKKCHFDSVDSTAWVTGNRFGYLYKFTGNSIIKIQRPPGTRVRYKEAAIHNFREWVKYQKWAETHL